LKLVPKITLFFFSFSQGDTGKPGPPGDQEFIGLESVSFNILVLIVFNLSAYFIMPVNIKFFFW
jgi:hypothetical protein